VGLLDVIPRWVWLEAHDQQHVSIICRQGSMALAVVMYSHDPACLHSLESVVVSCALTESLSMAMCNMTAVACSQVSNVPLHSATVEALRDAGTSRAACEEMVAQVGGADIHVWVRRSNQGIRRSSGQRCVLD
jgi:hypothetical protein